MNMLAIALAAVLAHSGGQAPNASGALPPAWVELAKQNRDLPLYLEVVRSTRWATPEEARSEVLQIASDRAIDFAAEAAPKIRSLWQVQPWFVVDNLLREPIYIEETDWTYGPMFRAYALVELSPDKRELILAKYRAKVVQQRIAQIGGGLGFVLLCLVTLATYLRLDDATRGYYSRWLGFGAVTMVAASAAALYTWLV